MYSKDSVGKEVFFFNKNKNKNKPHKITTYDYKIGVMYLN